MKISVTDNDIVKGLRNDRFHCPIAVSLRRMGIKYPEVFTTSLRLGLKGSRRLPAIARRFVRNFDCKLEDVKPFAFEVHD